ncbi:MAG: hypothetical protein JWL81_1479 [Verrucomicrobiales bacterium]|nr:hypothetical protein [Verrucomicrobiales bacterium]
MDVEGMFCEQERADCLEWIEAFGRRFPQLFLLVYVGPLPPPASPRQFAFWLLNHAAVAEAEALQPNERGLLLVVNPTAGSAVLTGGYFIENLLSQDELDGVLRGAAREFGRAEWAAGLGAVVTGLTDILKKKAKEANRHPERFQAPVPAEWTGLQVFPPLVRTGEGTGMDFAEVASSEGLAEGEAESEVGAGEALEIDGAKSGKNEPMRAMKVKGESRGRKLDENAEGSGAESEAEAEVATGVTPAAKSGGGRDGAKGKKPGAGTPGRTTRMVRALSGGKRNNPKRR